MSDLNIDLFENYIQNQLPPNEKSAFEAKLKSDANFKNEFDTFKILQAGFRANVLQEKLSKLKAHAATSAIASSEPSKHSSWYAYVLYGFLLLTLVGIILYFSSNKTNESTKKNTPPVNDLRQSQKEPQVIVPDTIVKEKFIPEPKKLTPLKNEVIKNNKKEIYAQKTAKNYFKEALSVYTTPTNFAIILRDSETSKDKIYADALQMFENKKYQDAVNILKAIDDEKSAYLQAHCLLLSGKSTEATNIFRNMADNDFSSYYQDAKWYLAISLLADYPQTKTELDKVLTSLESDPNRLKSLQALKSKIK